MQFSPTLKVNVIVNNWYAANSYSGSKSARRYNKDYGAFNNNYSIIYNMGASFTGKDYLAIKGLSANCGFSTPASGSPFISTYNPVCAPAYVSDNRLVLWRTYYSTPIFDDNLKVTVGPRLLAFDFLPVSNAVYGPKAGSDIGLKVLPLDLLQNAGVPGVYPQIPGAGGGISYTENGWSIAAGYVSGQGERSSEGEGLFGQSSNRETIVQLALTKPDAGFQLAWTNTYFPMNSQVWQEGTPLAVLPFGDSVPSTVNSFSGGGYWYITPDLSISGGVKKMYYTSNSSNSNINLSNGETASSITGVVTMQWERAFTDELTLGMSYGVPAFLLDNPSNLGADDQPNAVLAFANWDLTDNIRIAPWVYWMKGIAGRDDEDLSTLGAVLLTTFMF
jgi:hypothetical protein